MQTDFVFFRGYLKNLAETSEGVVLVGASAKSLSKAAKSEKQNLFIQIFDPYAKLSPSKFFGGVERVGKTSMDINDNSNTPLTKVTVLLCQEKVQVKSGKFHSFSACILTVL